MVAVGARVELQLRELARLEAAVGVGDLGAQPGAAAVGVDHRVDGHDLAGERVLGVGIDGHAQRLAIADLRHRRLRHTEIDLDRVQPHQRDEILADVDERADADLAQADLARERRAQRHLGQRGARRRGARLVDAERGARLVVVGPCDQLALAELAGARGGAAAVVEVRAGLVEAGLRETAVEGEQRLPGGDAAALGEVDAGDAAGDFGPHHHRLVGAQAADRLQPGDERLGLHGDGLDRQLHPARRPARPRGGSFVLAAAAAQGQQPGDQQA